MLLVYMDHIVSWGMMPMMTRKFEKENNKNNKEDKKVEEKGGGGTLLAGNFSESRDEKEELY